MKTFFTLILILTIVSNSKGQSKFKIGIANDVIIPTQVFAKEVFPGNGVGLLVRYSITEHVVIGANTALLFFGKQNSKYSNIVIPISGTLEYVFPLNAQMSTYVGFDAGYYAVSTTKDAYNFNFRPGGAPFIGINHKISEGARVFLTAKYFNVLSANSEIHASIAIGIGVTFRL